MENGKAAKFFEEVLAKTRAGRIRWEPTAEECNYIAAVGGQFTLALSEYAGEDTFLRYALVLKDQAGRVLTRVTSVDDGITFQDMFELYETARRQALRVDDKIDQVLGVLSKL